ncbi:hypothetical protein GCU67_19630 [Modestobacter muralis]|uniref:Uncharacterized protein n=1 Tax=Modestobacter muralis TaxID=1608614 RepID=A0A6P0F0D7_9ACTN|nr:hypothetical protein [Modestobacter muralis]NEK96359.1 hypothetical protein [Modestobacter muralis]NEN53259.1 hypothetical protein [Modestobacter muralis]
MTRVLAAARLQLAHPLVVLGVPWLVVTTSFLINLAIWGMADVAEKSGNTTNTGGLASLYITVIVVFSQAMTQMFPLAMGLSLSRRTYYLGTAAAALVQSLGFGLGLTVLEAVEDATNGWGVGLHFWAGGGLDVGNPLLQLVVFTLPMIAACSIGLGIGVVFKRWGAAGIYGLSIGVLLTAGVLAILVTWRNAWGDLWAWLTDRSVESLTITLPLVLAVAVAGLAYLGLRRTVP